MVDHPTDGSLVESRQSEEPEGAKRMRVDAAHFVAAGPAAEAPRAEGIVAASVGEAAQSERVHKQAAQLAGALRERQREIDHRDAQVNARLAQLETEMRAARLWLAEREAEIAVREQDCQRRQTELNARRRRLVEAARRRAAASRPPENWTERQIELAEQKRALELGRSALQTREQAVAEREQVWQRRRQEEEDSLAERWQKVQAREAASLELIRRLQAGLERRREALEQGARQAAAERERIDAERRSVDQRWRAEFATRRQQLEEAEAALGQSQAAVDRLHQELANQRAALVEEAKQERARLEAERRQAAEELEKKRAMLERRGEHVDQCRRALKRLRGELGQMHRETLEIRLATEELWAQLAGSAPPAALTHSLGRIRSKLADQYRLANTELQGQRKELEDIRQQLAAQHQRLLEDKRQFERWALTQHAEAEAQAARLVAREHQLSEMEAAMSDRQFRWEADRLELHREIRRLRCEAGCALAPA